MFVLEDVGRYLGLAFVRLCLRLGHRYPQVQVCVLGSVSANVCIIRFKYNEKSDPYADAADE